MIKRKHEGEFTGRRSYEIRADGLESDIEAGLLKITASTDAPIRGEILSHEPGSVDWTAAKALLLNHNPNRIIGTITNFVLENGELRLDAQLLDGAMLESGVSVKDAVKSGALRGVSIGYTYSWRDVIDDPENPEQFIVRKWRLLEDSLTPIPADPNGTVRTQETTQAEPAQEKERQMADPIVSTEPVATAHVSPTPEQLATARSEAIAADRKQRAEVATFMRSHDVAYDESKHADFDMQRAKDFVFDSLVQERKAIPPQQSITEMSRDEHDKMRDASDAAFVGRVMGGKVDGQNPFRGRSLIDQARLFAVKQGIKGVESWGKEDLCRYILNDFGNMRTTFNTINASLPNFVTAALLNKIVAAGYEMAAGTITYDRWMDTQTVSDFKSFNLGAMGSGNLQLTPEATALPELVKAEGVYNDALKMWGGTHSLSFQALMNDDTAQFERALRGAGLSALKTQDKRAYEKLLGATWTGNTTVGALGYTTADGAEAARTAIGGVLAAMAKKIGLDGNPIGAMAEMILVPWELESQVRGILNGQGNGQGSTQNSVLQVVASPWLSFSGLTGYSATSYYLVANKMMYTGGIMSFLSGYETPRVEEYDAGASVGRNWKIWQPFEASVVGIDAQAAGGIANLITGIHRGTAS